LLQQGRSVLRNERDLLTVRPPPFPEELCHASPRGWGFRENDPALASS
jgi:hypothetical protein